MKSIAPLEATNRRQKRGRRLKNWTSENKATCVHVLVLGSLKNLNL